MAIGWFLLAMAYLSLLFWIGRWGDRDTPLARRLTSHPVVYSLALAIYCTAWTFFGAVGEASRDNWQYLPILLGPILVYTLGFRFVQKLTLVGKKQNITTIADFISSRYGKRQTVALLVTLIALLATIPYVALQLKAIGSAFQLVSNQSNGELVVMVATCFIALFSIYFGTQRTDVTEYRRGLMLAIAFESTVKLLALIVVAGLAYFWWQSESEASLLQEFTGGEGMETLQSFPFLAQTIMAAAAVICLPRQFHVAIVDNLSLSHLKTARWLFPLYLALTAIVIPIIAVAGRAMLGDTGNPDTYVLNLAILSDSVLIQMLVFVGGLSAATAMIIVATLTLSTMITNDVILPKLLTLNDKDAPPPNYTRIILMIRRVVIGGLLLMAYLYHQQLANSSSLASIGLIAFSLVIQLMPAIIGGIYWQRGHAHGVYAGLLCGLFTWLLWLILPAFSDTNVQLGSDKISQGAMLSLLVNGLAYVFFSWIAPTRLVDRVQAQAFVHPREHLTGTPKKSTITASNGDLITLMSTFLGENRCDMLVKEYERRSDQKIDSDSLPNQSFIDFCEKALGGVLGSSSAKALMDSALIGKKLNFEEVVTFFDDTTQAIQFNASALFTSIESLDQGISVVDKNLNLVAWNKRYVELFDYPDEMISVGTPVEKLVRFNAEKGECGVGEIEVLVQKRLEHLKLGHPHRFLRQRSDGRVIEMVGNPLPGGGFVTSFNDVTAHIELQKALKESNIDLENRIRQRGEEVKAINAELRSEITRRATLEDELVNARKQAEEANASKTRFLALASHDVLQPLNAAKLYLSALDEIEVPEQAAEILEKLRDSVTSSEALIATLLDIARLDQQDMQPEIKAYSLRDLLSSLDTEFSMKAQQKGLHMKRHIQDVWIKTDKTYCYRIVQNLLSNAVKYCEKGKILLSARKQNGAVIVQVWDTGIGISPYEQKRIFSDFYRVEDSQEHGVGLGLGVVARLAEKLGVTVSIQSEQGKGSCFSVIFPLTDAPEITVTQPKVSHIGMQGLSVLCIDDKAENRDAMQTLLHKWNIEVALAGTPEEARSAIEDSIPDILLVDYHLGKGENGLDLIQDIRDSLKQTLPAVLVTANQEPAIVSQCESMHVAYLNKPVKPAKLRALLLSMQREAHDKSSTDSSHIA